MSTTYLLLCWSTLYFGIRYYESETSSKQREAVLKAVALAQESQLKMLRYQLNPHFLFNTLNAISTLILDNQNRTANHAITRLSEFLRYTLDQDPMKKVTLAPGDRGARPLSGHRATALRRAAAIWNMPSRARRWRPSYPASCCNLCWRTHSKYAISPREQGGSMCVSRAGRAAPCSEISVIDDGPGHFATRHSLTRATRRGTSQHTRAPGRALRRKPSLRGAQQSPWTAHRHGTTAGNSAAKRAEQAGAALSAESEASTCMKINDHHCG